MKDRSLKILKQIEDAGFFALPNRGGLHIHLGWPAPNPLSLLLFRILVEELEKDYLNFFRTHPERLKSSCSKNSKGPGILHEFLALSESSVQTEGVDLATLLCLITDPESPWNSKMNHFIYTRHQTLEIRLFNSTTNGEFIADVIKSFMNLVSAVRKKDKDLMNAILSSEGNLQIKDLPNDLQMQ